MKKILILGLVVVCNISFASGFVYKCQVTHTSVSSPLERIRGALMLTISELENGKSLVTLTSGKKRLEAEHYNSNLYVSKKQNFFSGDDRPQFVNLYLDPGLNGRSDRGELLLNPIWPNFQSTDHLYCHKIEE